jgi:hypothetical protein
MTATTSSRPNGQAAFPSFNWMRGVSGDKAITLIHRLVLVRLCLHRRADNGQCAPGYDPVAAELGVDRRTVFRAVDAGIKRGWIAPRANHGGGTEVHFAFTFPPGQPSHGCDGSGPQPGRPCHGSKAPTVAPAPPNRDSPATEPWQAKLEVSDIAAEFGPNGRLYGRIIRENKTLSPDFASPRVKKTDAKAKAADGKERRGPVNTAGGEAFARFWAAFPKRVAKGAALAAFAAAVERGVDPETLIAGAKRYAVERTGENAQYTKHPATWLGADCWDDEQSGPAVLDNDGNIIAFAARRDEPEPTEAEILREWGLHSRADEMLLRERGYGRA